MSEKKNQPPAALQLLLGGLLSLTTVVAPADEYDLTELSIEDLANLVVTSVSKKEERQQSAAAAIYVLTGDEIRAHGATNIAEALRLVPGLSVARSDAQNWAISARGFNSALADKMEVVLDGRSLYTPLFSGVFWDAQSTFIDDIERIEVIRGPGAAVWGANAVNGVINIVTRSAADTQGNIINLGLGDEVKRQMAARHGGRIGESGHYRVYAQGTDYDDSLDLNGNSRSDAWDLAQAGFRSDWQLEGGDGLTLQGDIYDGTLGTVSRDGEISGFNLLGRWQHRLDNQSQLSLQSYLDHSERLFPGEFEEERDTLDVELVHNFMFGSRHEFVWGAGFRHSSDQIDSLPGGSISFAPDGDTLETASLFVQDEYRLNEHTQLTIGTKIEENDFTGTEVQPTLRIAWSPDNQRTWWGSVSRAVRTPNRLDRDVTIQGFTGSDDFESEVALSVESGYRFPLATDVRADITVFFTDYKDLRAINSSGLPPFPVDNLGEGESWGVEASALWIPGPRSRWLFAYRYLDLELEFPAQAINGQLNTDPKHQAFVRGHYELSDRLDITGMLRYSDELPEEAGSLVGGGDPVPSYTELNLGLVYRVSPQLEWSLHGRDLLHDSHREFGNTAEIERSVFTQLKWRF